MISRPEYICMCTCIIISLLVLLNSKNAAGLDRMYVEAFLDKYVEENELYKGMLVNPLELKSFFDQYLNDTQLSNDLPPVKIKEVLEVTFMLQKNVAVLSQHATCNLSNHNEDEYKKIFEFPKTSQQRLHDWKNLTTAMPFKEYCNFFLYLTCVTKPDGTGDHCECQNMGPNGLEWEDGKCKFKKHEECRGVTQSGNLQFAKFDFVHKMFVTEIDPECVDKYDCSYDDNKCNYPPDKQFHWKLKDIAKALKELLDKDPSLTESQITEAMRWFLQLIKEPGHRLTLSLELEAQKRLSLLGQTCDPKADSKFSTILETKEYYAGSNPWKSESERLTIRQYYIKDIVNDDVKRQTEVCNHFELLVCSSGRMCVCKNGLELNETSQTCVIEAGGQCSAGKLSYKEVFKFAYFGPTTPVPMGSFYTITNIPCSGNTFCENVGLPTSIPQECVLKSYAPSIIQLQKEFSARFVLEFGETCNFTAQEALMGATAPDYANMTFEQKEAVIRAVVDIPYLKFCKITQAHICDEDTSKCNCIPGSDIDTSSNTCVAFIFSPCGHVQSNWHLKQQGLYLPHESVLSRPPKQENVICGGAYATCANHLDIKETTVCVCNNLVGQRCDVIVDRFTDFLNVRNLDDSMKTRKGHQIVNSIHDALKKLSERMELPLDGSCDLDLHDNLEDVLKFLRLSRDCCEYDGNLYKCLSESECKTEQKLDEFEAVLNIAMDLVKMSNVKFCDPSIGMTCDTGMCRCRPGMFLASGRCYLEIGSECFKDNVLGDPFHLPCRNPLKCDNENSGLCIVSGSGPKIPYPPAGPKYYPQLQQILVDFVKKQVKDLVILRRKGNGNICNWKEEQELAASLQSIDVLTDIDNFNKEKNKIGENDEILQHVRQMEPIISTLHMHMDVLYCTLATPCDHDREICTDGKEDKEDKISSATVVKVTAAYFLAVTQLIFYHCI